MKAQSGSAERDKIEAMHTAIIRESQLAASQVGQGVTALGKANHAETGLYAQAFFGLSIGLERMGKLIFMADYAISHSGNFPDDKALKDFGHDISVLLPKCEMIGEKFDQSQTYAHMPNGDIHHRIVEALASFATKLRYYNLNHLAGAASTQRDPIALWWEKVVNPICVRHYTQKQKQLHESEAAFTEFMMGGNAVVIHTAEDGTPISEITSLVMRSRVTPIVQRYSRMYVLQIVRWLHSIMYHVSQKGAYECRIECLLGMHEPFDKFNNEDRYLRNRKTW